MFKHAWNSMVITAWSELYAGCWPILEISSSVTDHDTRHSLFWPRFSSLTNAALYSGTCYSFNNCLIEKIIPNPPTHRVSTAIKLLRLGLGTVLLASQYMAVHYCTFIPCTPPIPWHAWGTASQGLSHPPFPSTVGLLAVRRTIVLH